MAAPGINSFGPEPIEYGDTGLIATGGGFLDAAFPGKVRIWQNPSYTGVFDELTFGTWAFDQVDGITIPADPNVPAGQAYLQIETDFGDISPPFPFMLIDPMAPEITGLAYRILVVPSMNSRVAPAPVYVRDMINLTCQPALGAGETSKLYYSVDDGQTWLSLVQGGSQVVLDDTVNLVQIPGPCLLGVDKSPTVEAVGIFSCDR